MILVDVLALLALGLAAYTASRVAAIKRRFPATGSLARVEDITLHYHRRMKPPDGSALPALVFLHGASGNGWDQLCAFEGQLKGRAELLFVDRPGLGYSTRRAVHSAPRAQARTIGQLLDHLGLSACVVVGHSLGASVAAALALERPDLVKAAVFVAPATHPWPGGVTWYYRVAALPVIGHLFTWTLTLPIAERVAPRSMGHVFSPDMPPENYSDLIRLPLLFRPASFRANSRDVARLKSHLCELSRHYGAITQPCLVVTGDADTVVLPSIHSDGLERDLPDVHKILLRGAGHMPHYTHTSQIAEAVLSLARDVAVEPVGSRAETV